MKKLLGILAVIMLIFYIPCVFAADYSLCHMGNCMITIPSNYVQVGDKSYTNENGNNVNIIINPFSASNYTYNNKDLEELANGMANGIKNNKEEAISRAKEASDGYMSEDEIDEFIDAFDESFEIHITDKDIKTYTSNSYKCYYIASACSVQGIPYYMEQYCTVSNGNIYTLTATAGSQSELQSNEMRSIINSFVIVDYKEPSPAKQPLLNAFASGFIKALIISLIFGLFFFVKSLINNIKNKKNSKKIDNSTEQKYFQLSIDDVPPPEEINYDISNKNANQSKECGASKNCFTDKNESTTEQPIKFCRKCGEKLISDSQFCHKCGTEIR